MAITKEIHEALDLKKLNLPPALKVQSIDVEDYVDWTGDEALRIWVTIDDSVDEFKISGKDVGQLKMAILDSLLAHGVRLFPYTKIIKPSEKAELQIRE